MNTQRSRKLFRLPFKPIRIGINLGLIALMALSSALVVQAKTGGNPQSPLNQAGGIPGSVGHVVDGGTFTTAQLMARPQASAQQSGSKPSRQVKPLRKADRTHLTQNPASPYAASTVDGQPQYAAPAPASVAPQPQSSAATAPGEPSDPQPIGPTNFVGATSWVSCCEPPDSMGAVGPYQFLIMVNGVIRSYSKSGVLGTINTDTDTWFSTVITPGSGTTDPRVRYDRLSGRWIITMEDEAYPNNRILMAASSGPDLNTATWHFTQFTQYDTFNGGCFADYPTLGVDAYNLYIGTNDFCGPPDSQGNRAYNNSTAYIVPKSTVFSTGPLYYYLNLQTSFVGPYTPQGADNLYVSAPTQAYFIGNDNNSYGLLQIRRVTNLTGVPVLSANIPLTVNATSAPPKVPNFGGDPLDGGDDRLLEAYFRNGSLWTAHNIGTDSSGVASGSPTRTSSRWYEITNLTTTPTVRQSGTIYDVAATNPVSFWMPAVAMSGQGHTAITVSYSSVNYYASAAAGGRLSGDTLGTTRPTLTTIVSGVDSYYASPGLTYGRWGDYAYNSVDPNDDMTIWSINEFTYYYNYTYFFNGWGVTVTQLLAPPPATPSSAPSVATGQASVNVVVTGTAVNGSGFYDPGPGFNRISASVPGVTVNSVTYTDPTHVTLNLNTVGAATGLHTVTITNPDGQVATGTNILNVIVPSAGDTVGIYNTANGEFYLSSNNVNILSHFYWGPGTPWIAISGDWDGNGTDTIGIYNTSDGEFYLSNNNSTVASHFVFGPGNPWTPIVGDWDKSGTETIGIYNTTDGEFYLSNNNSTVASHFTWGPGGTWKAISGDWDGDGIDTIGIYNTSDGEFYLTNNNSTIASHFVWGPGGTWAAIVGDWDGNGTENIGIYNTANGEFYTTNNNSTVASHFVWGVGGTWKALTGKWTGTTVPAQPSGPAPTAQPAPTFVPKR